jgi:hypothetical protein
MLPWPSLTRALVLVGLREEFPGYHLRNPTLIDAKVGSNLVLQPFRNKVEGPDFCRHRRCDRR